jgi:hypothetical protein
MITSCRGFVPGRARWGYLQSQLGDATEPYGSVLDKALGVLSETNESLEHVLDYISFMRVQGNRRIVSGDACKDLADAEFHAGRAQNHLRPEHVEKIVSTL